MGAFAVGDVVLVAFPYADFSRVKKRPALVVGKAEFGNLILIQITSQSLTSKTAMPLSDSDFMAGGLHRDSYVRPDKMFTIEPAIVQSVVGRINNDRLGEIKSAVRRLFD